MEPILHVLRLRRRADHAELEFPGMGPAFLARVKHAVNVQDAGIRLIVFGRVGSVDVVGGVHLLGQGPGCISLVTLIGYEGQERPEFSPLADEALTRRKSPDRLTPMSRRCRWCSCCRNW